MRIRSTPHCHTTYADGRSTAEEMVLSAIQAGFVSLGFSEHAPDPLAPQYALRLDKVESYKKTVRALREKYADKLRIHLGIERDLYSTADPGEYEYILAACHYFLYDDKGAYCAVDGEFEDLAAYRDNVKNGDGGALAVEYYDMAGDYARDIRPAIFAHFDLVKKQNKDGQLYDPDDPRVIDAAFGALEKIRRAGALLEVNTGGMARGFMDNPYPDLRYLKHWKELGGGVIVGSDCHYAPQIAYGFDKMPEYLAQAGFQTAWRLGAAGEPQFVEYPIN